MPSQLQKCQAFAELHNSKTAWIIPNPWDVGSAKLLEGLGFKALATTSSGFAYTLGRADGEVTLEEKLQHCQSIAAATTIPVNADFENGFAEDTATMVANIKRLAETGVAGFSIEDYSRDNHVIYDFSHAVERIQASGEAIKETGLPIQLTARAENLLRGVDDLEDTIKRLQAFEEAGADVLYAPGIKSLSDLRIVTAELNKPFNVLASLFSDTTVEQFSEAGAVRISVGGALNYTAINPLIIAGTEMLQKGSFEWLQHMAKGAQVKQLLSRK
ncbi:MAG: 2-methylisocitrate lyase [SAR86 cluster bacterium]|uniref:2-methylisocitrate lyase n=1 Tax=SAR86 cluster bacterium TaxID=2030880 RepID=A0A2A5AUM5_9GAMM|nr:MAG: 2-methylisocitrate lyase [SAR86 cluster bacterium]